MKPNASPFDQVVGNMSFDKRNLLKKVVEGLASKKQFTPTFSDWAAPSLRFSKNDEKSRLVVDYRGFNKHIQKTCRTP